MSGYSFAAWKAYCAERVRPQHRHDRARLARLDALLTPAGARNAWDKLARDVRRRWPAHLEPRTWQEALHNTIDVLVFPPSMIARRRGGRDKWIATARRQWLTTGRMRLPLMTAQPHGENRERNWVALYLRDRIMPAFFNRRHYTQIAVLTNIAWGDGDDFSATHVRLLQPFQFRLRRRGKPG